MFRASREYARSPLVSGLEYASELQGPSRNRVYKNEGLETMSQGSNIGALMMRLVFFFFGGGGGGYIPLYYTYIIRNPPPPNTIAIGDY